MRVVVTDEHRDYDSFNSSAVDEFFDFMLAALERPLMPSLGEEEETFKIAKAVVNKPGNLARVFKSFFAARLMTDRNSLFPLFGLRVLLLNG
jgi:hypothetical protein